MKFSNNFPIHLESIPTTRGLSIDQKFVPSYRLPTFLVGCFSVFAVIAGGFSLLSPACDKTVKLCTTVITISHAVELVICFVRLGLHRFAKKCGVKWITLYDHSSTFIYYSLLSYPSVLLHGAWMVWGFVEVNICPYSNYQGSIVVFIVISLVRLILNTICMWHKNMD